MRKKFLSTLSIVLIICSLFSMTLNAAEVEEKIVDGSYLTLQESSSGQNANYNLRGKYMMDGSCTISKAGIGKIYVYGQTTAHETIDKVGVLIYIEQYDEKNDEWNVIETLSKESKDTYYVSTAKRLTVERGTYYRVHAEHFVTQGDEFEEDISFTDGIMID